MAIYHCNISNVSRANGSSACATLSYITAKKIKEERTNQSFNFGRKQRVVYSKTILCNNAPQEFENPDILFNSIENFEKSENARTGKKIEVALPREFDLELQKFVIEEFINKNISNKDYCCTYALHHDSKNNNPHAHILIANRQINQKGEWGIKRKMEYALDDNGDRVPIIDKKTGKQKVDKRNRKQWKRINVYQQPTDKQEYLQELREQWAVECNRFLDFENQIDHRSYAEQGLDIIPTIHEGFISYRMKEKGIISDRAKINEEIKKSNNLIKDMKEQENSLKTEIRDKEYDNNQQVSTTFDNNQQEMPKSNKFEELLARGKSKVADRKKTKEQSKNRAKDYKRDYEESL